MSTSTAEATAHLYPVSNETVSEQPPLTDLLRSAELATEYANFQDGASPESSELADNILRGVANNIYNRLNVSDIRPYTTDDQASTKQRQRLDYAVRMAQFAQEMGYDPLQDRPQVVATAAKMLNEYNKRTSPWRVLKETQAGTYDFEGEQALLGLVKGAARELGGLDRDTNLTAVELDRAAKASGVKFNATREGRPVLRDESYLYPKAKAPKQPTPVLNHNVPTEVFYNEATKQMLPRTRILESIGEKTLTDIVYGPADQPAELDKPTTTTHARTHSGGRHQATASRPAFQATGGKYTSHKH